MRKSIIALIPAFVLALALSAAAQEKPITTNKENKDTLHASVSGTVQLDYVWRSNEMTAFTDSVGGGGALASDSENTFEGYLAIRMDVDLNDKVAAVVEFGTKRVDGGAILPWAIGAANPIQLREARVVVSDFLTQGLKFGVGISDWTFDVRGKGNSFAFDMRHSQTITRNLGTNQQGLGSLGASAGNPDELEPVGFWFNWSNNQITLDLVMLPAVIEGGPASQDEALYAIDFWYNLDSVGKGSRVGAILAVSSFGGVNGGSNTDIFTFGVGGDLKFLEGNLELYAEVYFQFGGAGEVGGVNQKAKGVAFQLGAQYTIPNNPIWLGINLTYVSGDNDTTDTKNVDRFVSYENINDLMILEDMYFGFDIDTNYMAVKVSGGFAMSVGSGKENLHLDAIIGFAKAIEDWAFAAGNEDALGTELDLKAKWILTKQASIQLGIAFLFGSDILEASMGGAVNNRSENNTIMYTLGAELKF